MPPPTEFVSFTSLIQGDSCAQNELTPAASLMQLIASMMSFSKPVAFTGHIHCDGTVEALSQFLVVHSSAEQLPNITRLSSKHHESLTKVSVLVPAFLLSSSATGSVPVSWR